MKISSSSEFQTWLESCHGLEDARIDSLHVDGVAPRPDRVELHVALPLTSAWRRGEQLQVRRVVIVAHDVEEYTLADDDFSAGHWCEGAREVEARQPVAFELDVPGRLRLLCWRLEVTESQAVETIPARYSDHELMVAAPGPPPSPRDWTGAFGRRGVSLAWRRYGDVAVSLDEVPEDYAGWFLQLDGDIPATLGGILIRACERGTDGGMVVVIECSYGCRHDLWACGGIFLSALPGAEVQCGNVFMSGESWREYARSRFPGSNLLARFMTGAT